MAPAVAPLCARTDGRLRMGRRSGAGYRGARAGALGGVSSEQQSAGVAADDSAPSLHRPVARRAARLRLTTKARRGAIWRRRKAKSTGSCCAILQRALYCLPLEQREVLLLVCVEELTYQEASVALSVPIGTVMSRLSRAREHMRVLADRRADALSPRRSK